jgi:type I restriction enzyme M protein
MRQIADIYAAVEEGELSRMLDYRRFGYRRIKVLRPLRMRLHITRENLAQAAVNEKAWAKLTPEQQAGWQAALPRIWAKSNPWPWAEVFVEQAIRGDNTLGKVGKPFLKALVNALGVRDPEGDR